MDESIRPDSVAKKNSVHAMLLVQFSFKACRQEDESVLYFTLVSGILVFPCQFKSIF